MYGICKKKMFIVRFNYKLYRPHTHVWDDRRAHHPNKTTHLAAKIKRKLRFLLDSNLSVPFYFPDGELPLRFPFYFPDGELPLSFPFYFPDGELPEFSFLFPRRGIG